MAGANEELGATNEGGAAEPYASDITSYGNYQFLAYYFTCAGR